jgi:hypothetical protein
MRMAFAELNRGKWNWLRRRRFMVLNEFDLAGNAHQVWIRRLIGDLNLARDVFIVEDVRWETCSELDDRVQNRLWF